MYLPFENCERRLDVQQRQLFLAAFHFLSKHSSLMRSPCYLCLHTPLQKFESVERIWYNIMPLEVADTPYYEVRATLKIRSKNYVPYDNRYSKKRKNSVKVICLRDVKKQHDGFIKSTLGFQFDRNN
jgi:hypothetical protein